MMGKFDVTWKMFLSLYHETENYTVQLHEKIVFDAPNIASEDKNAYKFWVHNFYDYAEYINTNVLSDDIDDDDFDDEVQRVYTLLGQVFWCELYDAQHALQCYRRVINAIETRNSRTLEESSEMDESEPLYEVEEEEEEDTKSGSTDLGECYKRMGDVYFESDADKALELYKKAVDEFSPCSIAHSVELAQCWSRIACLERTVDKCRTIENFLKVFTFLLQEDYQEYLISHVNALGECYLCLAKSNVCFENENRFDLQACAQALQFYLHKAADPWERELNDAVHLYLTLHAEKNSKF
jgi:hypothetical protein